MAVSINGLKRTVMCGEVTEEYIGKRITVMGWVQRKRNLGSLVFIDLRDIKGILQAVFGEEINKEAFAIADTLKSEYCVAITGEVVRRESPNNSMVTGQVELKGEEVVIFSESETPPIYIKEDLDAAENIRLKYRYLDLRRPDMQKLFVIRHKTTSIIRNYLSDHGFLEMETPILTKSTPEGARDYLVPSRNYNGQFYALPQSPQLFKQLLMVSGFDRYYQIAKCFRDEDLRANRQPEFTQVDMELSFVDMDDVMTLNEGLISKVFKEVLNVDVKTPFMRMPYKEAMDKYGSDKPDIRFGMEINDITNIVSDMDFVVFKSNIEEGGFVKAINFEGGAALGRKQIDKLVDFAKDHKAKGLIWIAYKEDGVKSSIAKFLSEEKANEIKEAMGAKDGDLVLIVSDAYKNAVESLGALRLHIAKEFDLIKNKDEFKFLWVTEFPLLSYDEEEKRYVAEHHPFTMPMDEDLELLTTDPLKVRAKAYDMVLNGEELGGGSIRIHDSKLQEKLFNTIGFSDEEAEEKFGFLLQAFKFGPPPHGGLAFGLDRMIMFLGGTDNIKDVITFPKNQNAACPMTEAPGMVDEKQLKELGIKVIEKEDK
ncbi:Aspartate-tRNA ligase [Clostridium bornimense]|uniref:Aspartate--tRNA ligase n=1 Tax=Clostridium bornimense TaxID=1216932 RepID=W6RXI7_9CLOT|nr:aspartate--tRNA ligase [Clostridium bornimense]CDM69158.1 Aspartate-tRNA ligase [Clostridium bornimense]